MIGGLSVWLVTSVGSSFVTESVSEKKMFTDRRGNKFSLPAAGCCLFFLIEEEEGEEEVVDGMFVVQDILRATNKHELTSSCLQYF